MVYQKKGINPATMSVTPFDPHLADYLAIRVDRDGVVLPEDRKRAERLTKIMRQRDRNRRGES